MKTKAQQKTAEYNKAYRVAHREEIAIYNKSYRLAHLEEMKAYLLAHREKLLAQKKARYAATKEKNKAKRKAYRSNHRTGRSVYNKTYRAKHPTETIALRKGYRMKKHIHDPGVRAGLSLNEFEALLKNQGDVCAICKKANWKSKRPHVDHDHKTGKIRGILCHGCNVALGMIKDDPDIALAMSNYLKNSTPWSSPASLKGKALGKE